jgi:glycosyltransferase involved in cell wall biosynthesis
LKSKLTKKSNHVIFVSRLHQKKGLEILIEAWESLKFGGLNSDWRLSIVGDGEAIYVESLHNLVKEKNLNDSVFFTGYLDSEDLYNCYESASIFVLPTSSENFGNVILEALSFGLLVITTVHTPWLSIRDYDCGEIIDNSLAELKASLERMISLNESEIVVKRQRSKELAKLFLPEMIAAKFDEVLFSL